MLCSTCGSIAADTKYSRAGGVLFVHCPTCGTQPWRARLPGGHVPPLKPRKPRHTTQRKPKP